jgi:hypothetical protein
MKAMEEAWAKAGEVGPNHAIIAGFEGEWECAVKEYGMDGKVSESKGTSSNTMVLGGRFLSMDYNGRMNGKFFRGLGMLGYCNMNKRFEHLWTDSMSTHMDLMTGSADASGKTLTFTGEMPDPVSGASMKERMVLKIADKQSYAMEMYVDVGGKEMKMMEIAFTRASKGEKKGADKAAEKASDKAEKAADKAADKPKKGKD